MNESLDLLEVKVKGPIPLSCNKVNRQREIIDLGLRTTERKAPHGGSPGLGRTATPKSDPPPRLHLLGANR